MTSPSLVAPVINPLILPHIPALTAFRRDMHQHPELGYEETRAGDKVVLMLRGLLGLGELKPDGTTARTSSTPLLTAGNERGFIMRGLGKTGVVVSIYGRGFSRSAPGPSVGIRADIDALPIAEVTGLPYASTHAGKMHACGHDGHTTMALGGAVLLLESAKKGLLEGTAHVIFQPAEEGGAGGKMMVDDGLFELFPCDAVFGIHNFPLVPYGVMGVRAGPVTAGSMRFAITVKGKGGHAAMPHLTVDPIPVACSIVTAAQTIVSRVVDPLDSAVVTFGIIKGGTVENIIPSEVVLKGTVRFLKRSVEAQCVGGLERLAKSIAAAHNCEATFSRSDGYPVTVNTPYEAAFMAKVMADVVGKQKTFTKIGPTMGSEDFGFMLEVKEGAYGFIGNGSIPKKGASNGGGGGGANTNHSIKCGSAVGGEEKCRTTYALHNPRFNFNDDNIAVGATFWEALARRWLSEGRKAQPPRTLGKL